LEMMEGHLEMIKRPFEAAVQTEGANDQ
jgi:hypothetical protein